MKVPFIHGPHDLRLCEVEMPRAGPRDVVLRVAATGVCGSDLGALAMGGVSGPRPEPTPLGHELSGTVIEAGAEVSSVVVGDRVILNPLINLIGNGGPEGGFAERLLVRDVAGSPQSLLKLPGSISFELGALVEPLAVGAHAATRLGAKPGDKVAIFGGGPIGLATLIALRHRGVEDVVVLEPSAFRRERALRLGARDVVDPLATPPAEALIALHGSVAVFRSQAPQTTHYLEASGAPLLPEIVAMARLEATICVASVQKKPVSLNFQSILAKELTITGTLAYPSELGEVIGMLRDGAFDPEPMISHRYAADEVMTAFETAQHADRSAKVLVRYE